MLTREGSARASIGELIVNASRLIDRPYRMRDDKGNRIVRVSVRGALKYCMTVNPKATPHATLDAADYDQYVAEGWPMTWRINSRAANDRHHSYLRTSVPYL